jgi:hypothetical protein
VSETTTVVPVLELAALDPDKREMLEKYFGQYGSEAIVVASNPDYVLWTDDLIQAQIGANEFGVRRVWTQLVFAYLASAGIITGEERDTASARLVGMGFAATPLDSSVLLEAVKLAEAVPWQRPLREAIEVFANPAADVRTLLGIFVDFAVKLYREPLLPENRCVVVCAILDVLWTNVAAREALRNIRRSISRLFGLNPVGESQFKECFDRWVKQKEGSIIVAV